MKLLNLKLEGTAIQLRLINLGDMLLTPRSRNQYPTFEVL